MSDAPLTRTGPTVRRGKSRQTYGTPWEFIRAVTTRFGPLTWDLACSVENRKAPAGFTVAEDSLRQPWGLLTGNAWLNPEFDDISPWAHKMAEEMRYRAHLSLMLTPASIGTRWFSNHVKGKAFVLGIEPRLTFEGCEAPYPKDLMLSVYGYGFHGFDTWRWTTNPTNGEKT